MNNSNLALALTSASEALHKHPSSQLLEGDVCQAGKVTSWKTSSALVVETLLHPAGSACIWGHVPHTLSLAVSAADP